MKLNSNQLTNLNGWQIPWQIWKPSLAKLIENRQVTLIIQIIWRVSKFSVKILKTHTRNQNNLTMPISLILAFVIQGKLIIYWMKSQGRSSHSKTFPILSSCYEANQSPSLDDVAKKFNQCFVNVVVIIFVSRSKRASYSYSGQTGTSLYTRSQNLKLRSSLMAWLTKHHLVMMA